MSLLLQALQGETPGGLSLQELPAQDAPPGPQGEDSGTGFAASREQDFSTAFQQPAPDTGKARPGLVIALAACVLMAGAFAWYTWPSPQLPAKAPEPAPVATRPALPPPAEEPVQDETLQSLSGPPELLAPVAENGPVVTAMDPPEMPHIEHHADVAEVHPLREAAWLAYQRGENAAAEALYRQMLVIDEAHREAQLGLAALELRSGRPGEAAQRYRQLLSGGPEDLDALAGLLARLQQTGGQASLAPWLGQHLAAGERWHEARAQFFSALQSAPDNAVLAFNLAVSLEHTGETRLAMHYYRLALQLGGEGPVRAEAERRLAEMEAP